MILVEFYSRCHSSAGCHHQWQTYHVIILRLFIALQQLYERRHRGNWERLKMDFLHIRLDIEPPVALCTRLIDKKAEGIFIFSRRNRISEDGSRGPTIYRTLNVNSEWLNVFAIS